MPSAPGTAVTVQDLFFNTPARLKFLKTAHTELAQIDRLMRAIALAHPAIHFRVHHNGKALLSAPVARGLRDRLGATAGFDLASKMLDVSGGVGGVSVTGLVAPPQLSRGNRDGVTLIVNGRPVRDTLLQQALIDAHRPLLARDQFPVAVLLIDVPSREVDVNVHPTKAWVRFRAPRVVQEALFAAVQAALRSSRVVQRQGGLSATDPGDARPVGASTEPGQPGPDALRGDFVAAALGLGAAETVVPDAGRDQPALFHEAAARYDRPRFGAVVGQLQDTFIVAANEDEVFFIDQHVAHERVLFERLLAELEASPLASQELLFPHALDVGAGGAALLKDAAPALGRLGFDVEEFGGNRVLLRAVPALLKGEEPRRLIEELLDEVRAPRRDQEAPLVHRALSFVACRAAIKAHAPLQREEMARLLTDLSATETPYFCPHGRPIVSRLSLREIKRELGRTW